MDNTNGHFSNLGNRDWQSQKVKEHFGQITVATVKVDVAKENHLLTRIGITFNKIISEAIKVLNQIKSH